MLLAVLQVSKVKLSLGKEGLFGASWNGPGQLATVSADHLVRVQDVVGEEPYVLSLTGRDVYAHTPRAYSYTCGRRAVRPVTNGSS